VGAGTSGVVNAATPPTSRVNIMEAGSLTAAISKV